MSVLIKYGKIQTISTYYLRIHIIQYTYIYKNMLFSTSIQSLQ